MRPLTDRGKEQAAVARETWFSKDIGVLLPSLIGTMEHKGIAHAAVLL